MELSSSYSIYLTLAPSHSHPNLDTRPYFGTMGRGNSPPSTPTPNTPTPNRPLQHEKCPHFEKVKTKIGRIGTHDRHGVQM